MLPLLLLLLLMLPRRMTLPGKKARKQNRHFFLATCLPIKNLQDRTPIPILVPVLIHPGQNRRIRIQTPKKTGLGPVVQKQQRQKRQKRQQQQQLQKTIRIPGTKKIRSWTGFKRPTRCYFSYPRTQKKKGMPDAAKKDQRRTITPNRSLWPMRRWWNSIPNLQRIKNTSCTGMIWAKPVSTGTARRSIRSMENLRYSL